MKVDFQTAFGVLIVLILLSLLRLLSPAKASWDGPPPTTPEAQARSEWFRDLKQPDNGIGCCSVADCRRTDAEYKNGEWWAVVKDRWTEIPKNKILNKPSIDGEAYVCYGQISGVIYCFVPPNMGM